jgi:hypothetical protein
MYERVNQCNVYLLPLYKTFTNVCMGAWLFRTHLARVGEVSEKPIDLSSTGRI